MQVVRLVVFAWIAAAVPESLHATCGDWLQHADSPNTASMPNDSNAGESHSPAPKSSVPLGSPCSGPTCGQTPFLPLMPVPIESSRQVSQDAFYAAIADAGTDSTGPRYRVCADSLLPGNPPQDRLERPPRG
ncbi:MAG: hypothetical protein R3C28_01915 [Pirellulaceae bacterium]